jgi:spermidine synthase
LLLFVLPLAFGSGVAALIYEVVWFQQLELVTGSTAVSLAVLLATFMGGMCLGSWLLPRRIPVAARPLRVYALIEFGLAVCGIVVLGLIPRLSGVATYREAVAGACILPPALLMGATLPVLARQAGAAADRVSWIGFFYGANLAGAVLGCLLAGFYLLRQYDVSVAVYTAASINLVMAGVALAAAADTVPPGAENEAPAKASVSVNAVYVAIALSGLCALGAEAIWTRLLALLFGASVYAFSIILAVFLIGLGIGSAAGSFLSRTITQPRRALGWCQLLAAGAIAWTAYNLSATLPYWPIAPMLSPTIWFHFELDFAVALWALLPATLLWGASFPLALAAAPHGQEAGRLTSGIYAANTLGAIIGALSVSLFLIAWVGSQHAQQVLIVLSAMAGLLLVLPSKPRWSGLAAAPAAVLLVYSVPPVAKLLIAYGRYAPTWVGKGDIVYAAEGRDSSVAVSHFANGVLTFHVAGKTQASNAPRDMRLQRLLGHLTTIVNAHPRSILVIGCGAGITAGAVSIDPRVERETIVEIEALVPKAADRYFSEPNFAVLRNQKVRLRIDDGRHLLTTTKERFDGITIDPLDPWVKGAANLYTQEFLETLKQHLSPGGIVTMYVQLFETNLEAVRSTVTTFFEVFPNGTIWGNPYQGKGHDMILLGEAEPLRIDLDKIEERIGYRGGNSRVASSLEAVGIDSPVDLFATYAGRKSDLAEWLRGAAINHDRNLRMEYLAGLGLDRDDAAGIYAGMLAFRRFPSDIFVSTEGRVDSLKEAIRRRP